MSAKVPAELAWLGDVLGAEATLALIEKRGGTRVYVPFQATKTSQLTQEIGLRAARALVGAYGGSTVTVPVARSWRVRHYHAAGLSYAAIARKLGCHEDTVWRLLNRAGETQRQLPLPF